MTINQWAFAVIVAAFGATSAAAASITGNPVTDGWEFQGKSTAEGTFVRKGSGALYDYDVYTRGFLLDGASSLAGVSAAWQAGDRIMGMGGVANQALDETFRTVNKWGAAGSTYAASTNGTAAPNDGVGSSSSGAGGLGSMLTGFNYTRTNGALDGAWNGTFVTPTVMTYFTGVETTLTDAAILDAARHLAIFSGAGTSDDPNIIASWQSFLNLSLLERLALDVGSPLTSGLPAFDANSIVTRQRSTSSSNFTDALAVIGSPDVAAVPLPAGAWLLLTAAGALVALRRPRAA
jgi:hypothetical protein